MTSAPPKDPVGSARAQLEQLHSWMANHIKPVAFAGHPAEWKRWTDEAESISQALQRPSSVRIALVGTTGAGKSTLLNALLEQQLLQVGVATSITSFVTLVRHQAGPGYEVEIEYETIQEWAEGVRRFLVASAPGDDGADGEAKSVINNMRKRIEAVHGIKLDDPTLYPGLNEIPVAPAVAKVFGGPSKIKTSFPDREGLVNHLRSVVRSDSPVWPLVKQVTISGPYKALEGGIELVDLPGTNDLNEARVDVTRDYIRNTPFVWLVFSMKRGITADGRKLLEEEKLMRTLVLSGSYNSLQLIGTHADDVDWAVASQFGLDPDKDSDADLVRAYRRHFVDSSRAPLVEIVEGLAGDSDRGVTLDRMLDLARNAPIHAVTARGYNNLKGVVRSTATFGLTDPEDTGIPGVLRALQSIADEVGSGLTGRTALQRIEHLRSEIATFFRARAAAGNPAAARAKASLEAEVKRLRDRAAHALTSARAKLETRRSEFLSRMSPLFRTSVTAVARKSEDWSQIQWATLRAIVVREGVFKSPSSGRLYDLNEDITDPLLNHLPVAWQNYFGTELGAIRDEFALKLEGIAEDFAHHASRLIFDAVGKQDAITERQLSAFRQRVNFDKQQCALQLADEVAERRRRLAFGMAKVAKNAMLAGYEKAGDEKGPGMKQRMLGHLTPTARQAAPTIYQTIQHDITESLAVLESILSRLFEDLATACGEQASIVAHNVNIDLDNVNVPPNLRALMQHL
jgi:GTPase SAR1 family protein